MPHGIPQYRCVFCGEPVQPSAEQRAQFAEGKVTAFAHIGELVEMSVESRREI